MGSHIELNDTLQITAVQGFPKVLNLARHLEKPYIAKDFAGRVFHFCNKSGIRVYHTPPVRNFLVENRGGKWLYWGLCEILSVTHDNKKKTTSGTFRILYLYTPDEMKHAHALIDRNPKTNFFT
ncbi:hypothetical protein HY625_02590 [Candidatus Uhrbacteria bacterium]|nr:hypothetical protein [Candidatus Uhrbacteria bacterium]